MLYIQVLEDHLEDTNGQKCSMAGSDGHGLVWFKSFVNCQNGFGHNARGIVENHVNEESKTEIICC